MRSTSRSAGRIEARRQLDQARGLAEKLAAATPNDLAVAECLRDAMAGLGAVCIHDRQYAEARDLLHRVVTLSEQIAQRGPRRAGARRGLIEAYLELGRAYGFDGQHVEVRALLPEDARPGRPLGQRRAREPLGPRPAGVELPKAG